jgi:hypothetical protein
MTKRHLRKKYEAKGKEAKEKRRKKRKGKTEETKKGEKWKKIPVHNTVSIPVFRSTEQGLESTTFTVLSKVTEMLSGIVLTNYNSIKYSYMLYLLNGLPITRNSNL